MYLFSRTPELVMYSSFWKNNWNKRTEKSMKRKQKVDYLSYAFFSIWLPDDEVLSANFFSDDLIEVRCSSKRRDWIFWIIEKKASSGGTVTDGRTFIGGCWRVGLSHVGLAMPFIVLLMLLLMWMLMLRLLLLQQWCVAKASCGHGDEQSWC